MEIVGPGQSAGAYLAVMLALDPRYLEAAGVDPAAVKAVAGLAGPYDFHPFDVPASINAFGRAPDPRSTQPVAFARPDAPPLFLGHGGRDRTVRPRNSIALASAVQRSGGNAELRIYPGLGHVGIAMALARPFRRRAPVLDDVMAFFTANS
jgi:acetyl esterase/lipase